MPLRLLLKSPAPHDVAGQARVPKGSPGAGRWTDDYGEEHTWDHPAVGNAVGAEGKYVRINGRRRWVSPHGHLRHQQHSQYSQEVISRIHQAQEGEIVGTLGDFIRGAKTREIYAEALGLPIMVLHRAVQQGQAVSRDDLGFLGALGTYRGQPTIFVNGAVRNHLPKTLFHEAAHYLRKLRGRLGAKQDFATLSADYGEVDPDELHADKMMAHAVKLGRQEDPRQSTPLRADYHEAGAPDSLLPRDQAKVYHQELHGLRADLQQEFPGLELWAHVQESAGGLVLRLDSLQVPKAQRGTGMGRETMRQLLQFADARGLTVALSPTNEWGAGKARLVAWYRRLGFVPNKGRHKDFAISETMLRPARAALKKSFDPGQSRDGRGRWTVELADGRRGGFVEAPGTFIRAGGLPVDAAGQQTTSANHLTGGQEAGVSVYGAWFDPVTGKYVIPSGSEQMLATQASTFERPLWEVTGEVVDDTGDDGEPLLKPGSVRYVRQLHPAEVVTEQDPWLTVGGEELLPHETPDWSHLPNPHHERMAARQAQWDREDAEYRAQRGKNLAKGVGSMSTETKSRPRLVLRRTGSLAKSGNQVVVETQPRAETTWRCPHCQGVISERGGLFKAGETWTHRACGGTLELPLEKSMHGDNPELDAERRWRDARDFERSLKSKLAQHSGEEEDPLEFMFSQEFGKSNAMPAEVLSAAGTVLAHHKRLRQAGQGVTSRTTTGSGAGRAEGAGDSGGAAARAGAGTKEAQGLSLVVRGEADDPEGEEGDEEPGWFLSGRNGVKYPAIYHRKLRRFTPVDAAGKPHVEKREKREKREKTEKTEKTEKGLFGMGAPAPPARIATHIPIRRAAGKLDVHTRQTGDRQFKHVVNTSAPKTTMHAMAAKLQDDGHDIAFHHPAIATFHKKSRPYGLGFTAKDRQSGHEHHVHFPMNKLTGHQMEHVGKSLDRECPGRPEGWHVADTLLLAAHNIGQFGAALSLGKSVVGHWFTEPLYKRHFSKEEMQAMSLRWITVHPNGAEEGTPLIVHDDGTHYTVVGGAGGKLNQMVFQKKTGDREKKKDLRKQKAEQKAKEIAKVKEDDPDAFEKLEAAEQGYREAAKAATEEYRQKAMEIVGAHVDTLQKDVAKEAEKRATKELGLEGKSPDELTDGEKADVQEFVEQAQAKVKEEVNAAVEAIVNQALDATARAAINQEAVNAENVDAVKAVISGKQLVKKLTNEEIQQLVEGSARADHLRLQANSIRRALRAGNADAVQGIQAALYDHKPTAAEVEEWTKNRYLNRESVITHTNLVKGSNLASDRTQRNAQAGGAADGLNHFVADLTGNAIVAPEVARKLGVEGTARVAAAYLRTQGVDGKDLAGKLGERIAQGSEADAMAALQAAAKLDAIAKSAVDASRSGDGTVAASQARIISGNMATQKYRLLNNTRGRLRGAAALAHILEHGDKAPLVIPAGNSKVGAAVRAKELGLDKGSFTVKRAEGGGYALEVPADKLHTLAKPHSLAEAERNAAMDDLRQDVDDTWQNFTSPHLKASLRKHQVLAVRAIVEQKRVLLNYGAGSGKTGVIYGAISELLSKGKVDKVLVTMPAKPRSQQENYFRQGTADELAKEGLDTPEKLAGAGWKQKKSGDWEKEETGEKFKFLTDDLHSQVTVIKDGADFDRKKAKIVSGELKAIVMSPELMRERREDLEKLGFGQERTAYFPDEAHKLSAGEGEGAGSGMAQAAAQFSKSEYFAPGTGTSIENNASELHSLLGMVHPDLFPKKDMKKFRAEWERTAAQITDDGKGGKPTLAGIFAHESMGGLRARLSGTMLSYHAPVKRANGEEVKFERNVHEVPLDEGQKTRIRELNATRDREMQHEDPKIRKAAPLRWQAGIIRSIIGDGMFQQMADMVKQGRVDDPAFRAVVWASEIAPLLGDKKRKGLKEHMGALGGTSQITGANSDRDTKQALDKFNDRTNDHAALMVSNAGNFGINAQGGNTVMMAGHPLVYSNLDQLEHRVNRTGQDKDVSSHIFIGDHPIMKQLFHNVMEGKGKSARLLEVLADDSLVGLTLAQNEKALSN